MTVAMNTEVQSNTAMHNLYYAAQRTNTGCKITSFDQEFEKEKMGASVPGTTESYSDSKAIFEKMSSESKPVLTNSEARLNHSGTITQSLTQISEWPDEDTIKPAFITFNSGLTGYDTVEYFYDQSANEDDPAMYMRTKTGDEVNYYKLDVNSVDPATATKAELLGYYSYKEYKGEDVDMYQLMADMDMAEHNGYTGTSDNLHTAFLKYTSNWLKALQNVLNIQKNTGDSKASTATEELLYELGRR